MAKKPQTPKPIISPQAPFEQTQTVEDEQVNEVIDNADIQAFRAFAPDTNMLSATLANNFNNRRREIRDSYGAYTGIPSQVVRNQLRDEALAEVDSAESLALAEGSTQAQALKMAQLEALASLTRGTRAKNRTSGRSSGYNTQVVVPGQQSSGLGAAALSGGAGVLAASMPAIIAA
jgi:hypothetical protein